MHIIYLHQYFKVPKNSVGGTRSYELARRLVQKGHTVDMVCSLENPTKDTPRGWFTTSEEGVRVHWLAVPYSNNYGFWMRVKAFLMFAIKSSFRAASLKGDLVFATSTPLTIAIPALYAIIKNKIPLVFEVRDLWPEAAIQMDILKSPVLIFLSRWLEKKVYNKSKHIIALSPGMKDGIVATGIPDDRVTVIPNASDLQLFSPSVNGKNMSEKLKLNGRFSLAYFGTMGPANGLNFIIDSAIELRKRSIDDIVLVLHGAGKERIDLVNRANDEGLTNVIFSESVKDKGQIAELAAAVDVCMTIYKNVPILYTCSPNKMFDSLAAGKPVLTNMPGWLSDIVTTNNCGVFVEPDNASDFADKAIYLRDNPEKCIEFGKNSRKLAENTFSRDILSNKLNEVLIKSL